MICSSNKTTTRPTVSTLILIFLMLAGACWAKTPAASAWPILQAGLSDKHSGTRVAAVRVLGLVPDNPHAAELAENALKDTNSAVRSAAATALGQMHVSGVSELEAGAQR